MANRYWVNVSGQTGYWEDSANWALTSGGAGGASAPAEDDIACFDHNSFIYYHPDVRIRDSRKCLFNISGSGERPPYIAIESGGSLELQSELNVLAQFSIRGSFVSNNYNISVEVITIDNDAQDVNIGESIINVSESVFLGKIQGVCSFGSGARINLIVPDGESNPFALYVEGDSNGYTRYPDIYVTLGNGADVGIIYGEESEDCVLNSLFVEGDGTFRFDANGNFSNPIRRNLKILSDASFNGLSAGGLLLTGMQWEESDFGPWGLFKSSGLVGVRNCNIKNGSASGGATFNALLSDGNVDGGGNSGWNFGVRQIPNEIPVQTVSGNIVAFSNLSGRSRNAEYTSKRYAFPFTSLSVIKVLADKYPVDVDVVYPAIPMTMTVRVLSAKPQRIKSLLVDSCEIKFLTSSKITAIFLASSMGEIPI